MVALSRSLHQPAGKGHVGRDGGNGLAPVEVQRPCGSVIGDVLVPPDDDPLVGAGELMFAL